MPASRALARLAAALAFAYVLRGNVVGLPFTTLELALVALIAAYLVEKVRSGERFPGPRDVPYSWPVLLLVAAATISLFVSPDNRAAAGIWKAYFVEPALGYYVLADVLRSRADLSKLLEGFFIGGVVVAVLNEVGFMLAVSVHRPHLTEAPVVVLFNTPNATGLFLGPLMAAAAALAFFGDRIERVRGAIFFLIAAPALAFSFSRGAWLGLGLALVMIAVLHRRRVAALGALGVAVAVGLLVPAVRQRIAHQFDPNDPYNSVNLRSSLWKATVEMMQKGTRPVLGNGLSGFKQAITPFKDVSGYHEDLIYPHNSLLTFWTETGLLGVVAFTWLVLDAGRRSVAAIRAHTAQHTYHVVFAAAALTMFIHGLIDVPYFKNDLAWMTMALLGMHAAALRIDRRLA